MNKKVSLVSVLFFVFIVAIVAVGCSNILLKSSQSTPSILVQLENSGARNASTTGDWQISAWIENQDGSESHHQNLNSASGEETSLIFDDLVIGSQINIHLELTKNDDNQTKLTGESDWFLVKEGEQVIEIELKSMTNTDDSGGGNGEGGSNSDDGTGDDGEDPASGNPGEGDEKLVLTSFEVQYDSNQYQLVNTNINLSNITITQLFNNGSTKEVKASEVSNDYVIAFADGVDTNNAIGYLPAYVEYKHDSTIEKQQFIIPIKYQLDANNLTISGDASVEQNEELKLTAEYMVDGEDSYKLYTSASSSGSYKIIENVTISWTGATAQSNPWEANANTQTTGQNTATVKLTSTDTEWCVTTSEITKEYSYEVTAVTASIGDIVYSDGTVSTSLNSGKTPVGIVIKTTDSQPTLILALNNGATTELTYSKAEEACSNYGTTCGDGKTTWRIPSATEWKDVIYANKDKIQSALTTAGGSQMGTGYYYWTSNDYQRIILSSGVLNRADRSDPENASTTHARFVRDWQ